MRLRNVGVATRLFALFGILGGTTATALVACGGDDSGVDTTMDASTQDGSTSGNDAHVDAPLGDAGPSSVDDFCAHTLALYAPKLESCCSRDAAPSQYDFDDLLLRAVLTACSTNLGKSVASGRASLDSASASSCAANMQALLASEVCPDTARSASNQPTTSLFHDAGGCATAIVGHQAAGAPCADDYECQDGLTCVGWTSKSDGTCMAPPAVGKPCGNDVPDGSAFVDLLLWGFGTHPRCATGGYCATTAVKQGACTATKGADASCFSMVECSDGLRCQLGTCNSGGPVAEGAPCVRSSDCQDRLYCKTHDGGATCQKHEAAGTPCGSSLGSECQGACVVPDGGSSGSCVAFCGSN